MMPCMPSPIMPGTADPMSVLATSASTGPSDLVNNLHQACQWTSGIPDYDDYIRGRSPDASTLRELASLPQEQRGKIMQSTKNKDPTHIDSWLLTCIRRAKDSRSAGPYQPARQSSIPTMPPQVVNNGPIMASPGRPPMQSFPGMQGPYQAMNQSPSAFMSAPTPPHTPVPDVRRNLFNSPANDSMHTPTWVSAAFASMKNMSECMGVVFEHLDSSRVELIMQLPTALQMNIAVSILFNPNAWHNPNEYVQRTVETVQRLAGPAGSASPTPAGQIFKVVVLTAGFSAGTGHMSLHAALQQMKRQQPETEIQVVGVYSFEIDKNAVQIEKQVASALGWTVHQCGDASNIRTFVYNNMASWQNCRFMLLASLPSKHLTDADDSGKGPGTALHQPGCRLVWEFHKTIIDIQLAAGPSSCVHLVMARSCKHHQDDNTLNGLLGSAMLSRPSHYHAPDNPKYLRSNPSLKGVDMKFLFEPIEAKQSIDGWVWLGNAAVSGETSNNESLQHALSDDILNASASRLFHPEVLKPSQTQALQSWLMEHMSSKEQRLLGRKMWLHFLGVRDTPLAKILDEVFPCYGTIIQVTGAQAAPSMTAAKMCGDVRYCRNCVTTLKLLSRCWHVAHMADVLVALVRITTKRWSDESQTEGWELFQQSHVHDCSDSCALQHSASN